MKKLFVAALLLMCALPAFATSITLAWDLEPGVAGYNLYYGTSSGNYTNMLTAGNFPRLTVANLSVGVTYYFAATAFTIDGLESGFSTEISYTVPGGTNMPPAPPVLNSLQRIK